MGEVVVINYSVLIVDDDIKLTELLKTYFEKDGFMVLVAYNGRRALELIRDADT